MGIYAKIFVLLAAVCMISALPVESEVNEPQVDLLAAESSPITDNESTDEVTRDKRHGGGRHFGEFEFIDAEQKRNCWK
jgi:predicted nucleotidyltransferase